jgi:hypothetical protein
MSSSSCCQPSLVNMIYLITHLVLEKLCLLFFPSAFVHLINYVGIVFMNVIFLNFNDNYGVSLINIE